MRIVINQAPFQFILDPQFLAFFRQVYCIPIFQTCKFSIYIKNFGMIFLKKVVTSQHTSVNYFWKSLKEYKALLKILHFDWFKTARVSV